jgi:catechol 2,3-dioxygenase-like lactoylglutathione lyase family enzyme
MTTSSSSAPSPGTEDATASRSRLGRLSGVTVGVPDPDATADWLRSAIGFTMGGPDGHTALCAGDYGDRGQAAITLVHAAETAMLEGLFEVSDDYDLNALGERLTAAGVEVRERDGGGLSFADAAGNPLGCARSSALRVDKPRHEALRPRRLGHMNIKAPDASATAAFYQEMLGMRLSEQIGDGLYFLRIATEHHNVGLRPGERGELHHLGLELDGWHAYQPILDRLASMDLKIEYGPGRHGPGNNIFTYLCEPSSGLRVELFADMAHIPDETTHRPLRWEAGDRMTKTINRWGPLPPPSFLE